MLYMPLIPYEYYTDMFRAGSPRAKISAQQWGQHERRAWASVNFRRVNLNSLRDNNGELPTPLKDAVCAVAEVMQDVESAPAVGGIKSERNFDYQYTLTEGKTESDISRQVETTIAEYLFGTEWHNLFVYRGTA